MLDVIEYLELTWMKMDYYNKAETNKRNTTKNICILNLEKGEIDKIDRELFEQLRVEAKNSNKLNLIVTSFIKHNLFKLYYGVRIERIGAAYTIKFSQEKDIGAAYIHC